MTQEAKGLFVPYPLLGIMLTLAIALVTGLITLWVQVSNLNTTILLRDADQRAAIIELKEKTAQLEVYLHDDRERLVRLQAQTDKETQRR